MIPQVFITHRIYQRQCLGMTLVELLLVLLLLVIVASLAVPILDSSFSTVRLQRASDQVMASFSRARSEAIKSGQIYQFLFTPREGDYKIQPWSDLDVESSENEQTLGSNQLWSEKKNLPDQVTFSNGEILKENEVGQQETNSLLSTDTPNWSTPILFFPNGTTSSASVLLENEQQLFQQIKLRALTGVARASSLLSKEEVQQAKSN